MGRIRVFPSNLPKYVTLYHGAYYFRGPATNWRRVHLGRDLRIALTRQRQLCKSADQTEGADADERFVYLIGSGDERPIKIGIANNVEKRLAGLQTGHAEHLRVAATYLFEARRASEIEVLAHAQFKDRRLAGEWFAVTARDAARWIEAEFIVDAIAVFRPRIDHQDRNKPHHIENASVNA